MAVLVPTMAVFEKLQVGAPTTIVEHTLLLVSYRSAACSLGTCSYGTQLWLYLLVVVEYRGCSSCTYYSYGTTTAVVVLISSCTDSGGT
jgi:hypothetical protein